MTKLKMCPFCGELPRTEASVTKMGGTEDHVDFSIHCTNCGIIKTVRLKIVAYANFVDVDKAISEVITAWNQRMEKQEQSCDTCKHKSEGFNSRRCGNCSVGYPDRYEAETNFEATSKNFELYTEEEA